MPKKAVSGVGAGLGLTQGFVALALQLQDPTPNPSLAKGLWIGAAVTLGATLIYWLWPRRDHADETHSAAGTQDGSDNVQAVGGRDAIAQSGGKSIAQQGERNIVVEAGGTYYETKEHVEQDRVIVDTTPEQVTKFYRDHVSLHADKLFTAVKGKWMRVAGNIDEMWGEPGKQYRLVLARKSDAPIVALAFDDPVSKERLDVLDRGSPIRAIGQIDEAHAIRVALINCELE
jgi:hypothetical protein